jgi:hypothetical protein
MIMNCENMIRAPTLKVAIVVYLEVLYNHYFKKLKNPIDDRLKINFTGGI